jgi:hypothetical protein
LARRTTTGLERDTGCPTGPSSSPRRLNATFIEGGAADVEREGMRYRSEEQAMHHRQRAAHHRREAKRFAAAELHENAQVSRTAALAQERLVYALETGRLPR